MRLDPLALVAGIPQAQAPEAFEGSGVLLGDGVHRRTGSGKSSLEVCNLLSEGEEVGSVAHQWSESQSPRLGPDCYHGCSAIER